MDISTLSIEEARELAELTNRIVANLKAITEEYNTKDLDELESTTGNIVANFKAMTEDYTEDGLDDLAATTGNVVANFKAITEEYNIDADAVLEKTCAIVANLEKIQNES